MSRVRFDKREKEGMGVQKYNVPSSPSQLPLQGRLEGPEEKMSTENMASAEQVRGGCSDLWVLLSQFLESLCYKGNSFCRAVPPQVRNKGWVELGTDPGRLQLSSTAGVALAIVPAQVYSTSGNCKADRVRQRRTHICYPPQQYK